MEITIQDLPKSSLAYTNKVYCNPRNFYHFEEENSIYVRPRSTKPFFIYTLCANSEVDLACLAMSRIPRDQLYVAKNDVVEIEFIPSEKIDAVGLVSFSVKFRMNKDRNKMFINTEEMLERIRHAMKGVVVVMGQDYVMKYEGKTLLLTVETLFRDGGEDIEEGGILDEDSVIELISTDKEISLDNGGGLGLSTTHRKSPLRVNIPFEEIGIGGLAEQWRLIYRRAFSARNLSPSTIKKWGLRYVKGILLHGPPGTGKTLIARKIGQLLTGREPKKISGAEILSKWVGQAEQHIRDLFVDAEMEQAEKGDNSELHVIIFDELDAVCRARGSSSHNIGDSIVNQLLAKMDGVDEINNILIIGMTNRKDLIDAALLRPNRFELLIEIPLPDEAGREEIFKIHTKKMRENEKMEEGIDLADLARRTKNYSGAEILGLVSNAQSYAISRQIDPFNMKEDFDEETIKVCSEDFERALRKTVPAFGSNNQEVMELLPKSFVLYNTQLNDLMNNVNRTMDKVLSSAYLNLHSIVLVGPRDSGKTSLATRFAVNGKFPMVRVISADMYIGQSEMAVATNIKLVFQDLYRSEGAIIILDDLERILQYNKVGHSVQYSNTIFQAINVFIRKRKPKTKLFIIGTTEDEEALETLDLLSSFNEILQIPLVHQDEDELAFGDVLMQIEENRFSLGKSDFTKYLNTFENPNEWKKLNKIPTDDDSD